MYVVIYLCHCIYLSTYLSVYLFVCLSACLIVYLRMYVFRDVRAPLCTYILELKERHCFRKTRGNTTRKEWAALRESTFLT